MRVWYNRLLNIITDF